MSTTLAALRPGQAATITAVGGARAFRRRLLELGLLPGVDVRMIKVAPLGDPLEIEARGCRLSMRAREAEAIAVSLEAQPRAQPKGRP